ncbi:PilZ domain-containing protein [Geomonas subterranea]|uniref:PilZ domain-containing protein n=1 Tax=Geomonas subterranea TaxID=2847989 RepID=A0ABX8LJJ4_9BACT|nr:PilZ domain-containing protein [Geomonas subterranea]QXE90957.1 PilZ domain-containing protein [Geomonas subterranea]QXM10956.1 PilZ domain-containing protein [Geomonas subterranea]
MVATVHPVDEFGSGERGFDDVAGKKSDRVDARIAIFEGPYQKTLVLNYSVNVSPGGLFIESSEIRPVDTLLTLKFRLTRYDTVICCQARVAWTNEPGALKKPELPVGMGLSFVGLRLSDLHALRSFLERSRIVPVW